MGGRAHVPVQCRIRDPGGLAAWIQRRIVAHYKTRRRPTGSVIAAMRGCRIPMRNFYDFVRPARASRLHRRMARDTYRRLLAGARRCNPDRTIGELRQELEPHIIGLPPGGGAWLLKRLPDWEVWVHDAAGLAEWIQRRIVDPAGNVNTAARRCGIPIADFDIFAQVKPECPSHWMSLDTYQRLLAGARQLNPDRTIVQLYQELEPHIITLPPNTPFWRLPPVRAVKAPEEAAEKPAEEPEQVYTRLRIRPSDVPPTTAERQTLDRLRAKGLPLLERLTWKPEKAQNEETIRRWNEEAGRRQEVENEVADLREKAKNEEADLRQKGENEETIQRRMVENEVAILRRSEELRSARSLLGPGQLVGELLQPEEIEKLLQDPENKATFRRMVCPPLPPAVRPTTRSPEDHELGTATYRGTTATIYRRPTGGYVIVYCPPQASSEWAWYAPDVQTVYALALHREAIKHALGKVYDPDLLCCEGWWGEIQPLSATQTSLQDVAVADAADVADVADGAAVSATRNSLQDLAVADVADAADTSGGLPTLPQGGVL